MSPEAYQWCKVLHLIGVVFWAGGLFALAILLPKHGSLGNQERGTVVPADRTLAMAVDIAATLAIVLGVILLIKTPGIMKQPSMHAKLTGVVVLIGIHGYLRVRLKRLRLGATATTPSAVAPLLFVVVATIIALVVAKPF